MVIQLNTFDNYCG